MWHVDAYKGTSWSSGRQHEPHWVMVCYYPQATTLGMGPTELLPGTQHLRGDSDREHYSRGHIPDFGEQMERWASAPHAVLCEAGSIVVMHFDLWHRALETTDADASRLMLKFVAWRTAPPPAAATAPPWPLAERRCADGDPLLAFLAPPPVAAAAAPPSDLGEVCELLDAELRELCAAGALWPAGGAPLGPKAVAAAEAALYDRAVHRAKEHAKGWSDAVQTDACTARVARAALRGGRRRGGGVRAARALRRRPRRRLAARVGLAPRRAARARRGRRRRRVARGAARRARRRHRG